MRVGSAAHMRLHVTLLCNATNRTTRTTTMVKIEEVPDATEKVRQQGLNPEFDDGDEWEATDDDSDEVRM